MEEQQQIQLSLGQLGFGFHCHGAALGKPGPLGSGGINLTNWDSWVFTNKLVRLRGELDTGLREVPPR